MEYFSGIQILAVFFLNGLVQEQRPLTLILKNKY